jgi:hypothetical protein
MTGLKYRRHCLIALRLVLCGVLVAHGFPVRAQTADEPADRSALRQLAPSSLGSEDERGLVRNAQFMPGMPAMPPMMMPRPGGTQGSMGGGMTMVMTGDTMLEMAAGACTAGLFIGGVAASAAGMVGMMGARKLSELFK